MNTLQSYDAECAVLGMCLESQSIAETVAAYPDDMFTYRDTMRIHKAIRKLVKEGRVPDQITLMQMTVYPDGGDCSQTILDMIDKGYGTAWFNQREAVLKDCRDRRLITKPARRRWMA